MLEALAGVLSGAKFGRQHAVEVEQGEMPWDEGHFFLAFDPGLVMPIAEFKRRMDALIRDVRSASPDARTPGQAAWERKRRALREGLRLPSSVYRRLREAAERAGTATRLACDGRSAWPGLDRGVRGAHPPPLSQGPPVSSSLAPALGWMRAPR